MSRGQSWGQSRSPLANSRRNQTVWNLSDLNSRGHLDLLNATGGIPRTTYFERRQLLNKVFAFGEFL